MEKAKKGWYCVNGHSVGIITNDSVCPICGTEFFTRYGNYLEWHEEEVGLLEALVWDCCGPENFEELIEQQDWWYHLYLPRYPYATSLGTHVFCAYTAWENGVIGRYDGPGWYFCDEMGFALGPFPTLARALLSSAQYNKAIS